VSSLSKFEGRDIVAIFLSRARSRSNRALPSFLPIDVEEAAPFSVLKGG